MDNNDMVAADMEAKQTVNYTYFSSSLQHTTWIDHVLVCEHDLPTIKSCNIVPIQDSNTSDHLPIQTTVRIYPSSTSKSSQSLPEFNPRPNWNSPSARDAYSALLTTKLQDIGSFQPSQTPDKSVLQDQVNTYLENLSNAIHASSKEAGCVNDKQSVPKKWWCPQLSQLRDKTRFWRNLWNSIDRPRSGQVYNCYKAVKKLYRKTCRQCVHGVTSSNNNELNAYFRQKRTTAFWNAVRRKQRRKVSSTLKANDLAKFYSNIMKDDKDDLSPEQEHVVKEVKERYTLNSQIKYDYTISASDIRDILPKLNKKSSPGSDGVTAEHLLFGNSALLVDALASVYTVILSESIIPDVFCAGTIIPILKKPSLNPNLPENFRPITISSTFAKILELLILPPDSASATQYGFRPKRSTSHACTLLHDTIRVMNHGGSPVYVCALDAEKCFDTIWHDGLFYKLWGNIPPSHWIILYKWYKGLSARVLWNGQTSESFQITKGTRQGSILSPQLFNMFINDLLYDLTNCEEGVRMGPVKVNSFAYADDLNLLSATVPGLQKLIDLCTSYATKWRFKFNEKKSKCMIAGNCPWPSVPTWCLGNLHMETADSLEILGVTFSSLRGSTPHTDKRINSCRSSFYSLSDIGLAYPGLSMDVKVYLWRTVCQPVITYGFDAICTSKADLDRLQSTQGSLIKRAIGLGNRSHHSSVLQALDIKPICQMVENKTVRSFANFMSYDSPTRDITSYLMSKYIAEGVAVPGTIISRLLGMGLSPLLCAFNNKHFSRQNSSDDCNGVVDSLRHLLKHENYLKPYSDEHLLVRLLTRAF